MLVPGMMGRILGEYTTTLCGLFAAVGGGLTAVIVSTVVSASFHPIIDSGLSNAEYSWTKTFIS